MTKNFATVNKYEFDFAAYSPNSTPILRFEVQAGRTDDAVVGLASMNNRLYILRLPCPQQIDVYDISSGTKQDTLHVEELDEIGVIGFTCCETYNCLYYSCNRKNTVYKIELANNNKVTSWAVGNWPEELSVNADRHLLVACFNACMIQEFTTHGELVRVVSLRSGDNKFHPFHAVQLTSGRLVVSGCYGDRPREYDVVEVDCEGRVDISYTDTLTSTTKQKFMYPSQVLVDQKEENILVADCDNNRIVTLNRSKKVPAREFNAPSVEGGLVKPWSICYDEAHNRLHVGEANWRNYSRVFVFDNVINIANS
jgi:DNA-binding beta-propeller fold protein YncE